MWLDTVDSDVIEEPWCNLARPLVTLLYTVLPIGLLVPVVRVLLSLKIRTNSLRFPSIRTDIVLAIDHDCDMFCRVRGITLEVKYTVEGSRTSLLSMLESTTSRSPRNRKVFALGELEEALRNMKALQVRSTDAVHRIPHQ